MSDYDLDGDLDIYVANYVTYDATPFEANITGAEADFLYINVGDGRFELTESPTTAAGCTLVASFSDYDRDGDSDLFLLNDFGDFYQPNQLFRNDLSGGFTDVSEPSGMQAAINSMGIAVGDINHDSYFNYYISDIGNNLLYLNQGGSRLENVTYNYSVNDGKGFNWGAAFLDIDNDTDLDLFVGKGSTLSAFDPQYNRLYLNLGAGDFEDISVQERIDNPDRARGAAVGDFNNDGHNDLVVTCLRLDAENAGRTLVYINQGGNSAGSWLSLQLQGKSGNPDAIGSVVTAFVGGMPLLREVSAGNSYLSSHSTTVHFGLGQAQMLDSLTVDWPGGQQQTFRQLGVNTSYRAAQNEPLLILQRRSTVNCEGSEALDLTQVRYDTLPGSLGLDTLRISRPIASASHDDCVVSATNEVLPSSELMVYPNPFTDIVTIRNQNATTRQCRIQLLNYLGQELVNQETILFPLSEHTIHFAVALPPGGYLLSLTYDAKHVVHKIWKAN